MGFRGLFKDSTLVAGFLVEVTECRNTLQGSILVPEVRPLSKQMYNMDIHSQEKLSHYPLLSDPYEQIFVEVRESRIPRAGDGLFAKVDIEIGTVISFYNGIKVKAEKVSEKPTPFKITL